MKRLVISDGSLEGLKWLALLLMTGDHVDKYLFHGTITALFDAGRLALPLFIFVLAYNLARPDALENGGYGRTMKRLALFGALATPAFVALGGLVFGGWPLNVMFTLLAMAGVLRLLEIGSIGGYLSAAVLFLVGGSSVEFWWPALTFGVAVWWYCKQPGSLAIVLAVASLLALWVVNSNQWALMAIPVLLAASLIELRVPRQRWAFYAYYPLHLGAIWLIRIPMSKYLVF